MMQRDPRRPPCPRAKSSPRPRLRASQRRLLRRRPRSPASRRGATLFVSHAFTFNLLLRRLLGLADSPSVFFRTDNCAPHCLKRVAPRWLLERRGDQRSAPPRPRSLIPAVGLQPEARHCVTPIGGARPDVRRPTLTSASYASRAHAVVAQRLRPHRRAEEARAGRQHRRDRSSPPGAVEMRGQHHADHQRQHQPDDERHALRGKSPTSPRRRSPS